MLEVDINPALGFVVSTIHFQTKFHICPMFSFDIVMLNQTDFSRTLVMENENRASFLLFKVAQ